MSVRVRRGTEGAGRTGRGPAPVLHVAPFLWSGAGRVITALAIEQQRTRPVTLVTTGRSGTCADWPAYRAQLRRAGVVLRRAATFHREPERFWQGVEALTTIVGEVAPAVIHTHAGVPAALAAVARKRAGSRARLVAQMYSWGVGRPQWMNVHDAWAFGAADRVVCSARAYERLLVAHGVPRARLTYLPWGLDLRSLPFGDATPGGPPTIGFVGRLEARKGQLALVEAFARLRRRHPEARLELVGPVAEPAYAQAIQEAIRTHGLDEVVRLTGQVRDVVGHVRRWHLFVSLSSDEGQGLAVLEAMALGVPVVARAVAGIEDFLTDDGTGWTVDSDNPEAVASTLHRVLTMRLRGRVVHRARALVERRFDWTAMLAKFDRLYRG